MKKIFYFILAAAAIVASCAKEPISEPVSPSGDGSSVFTGTIIQPGGIDEATKVSIIDQTSDPDNVYIKWTINDQIYIIKKGSDQWNSTSENDKPKVFYAVSSEATTDFSGTPPDGWIAPDERYSARYYGKNDVWREYVLAGESVKGITIDCKSNAEAAFLENMPLSCGESVYDSGKTRYNFTFSNAYAILQINVPSKLSFEDLYVCVNAQNVEFESGQLKDGSKYTLCLEGADAVKSTNKYIGKDLVTYFVPVSAGNYDKLTIVAAKGNAEVARMETYAGNVKNGSDSPYVLPQLYSNNIYPFDFCNTLTIGEAGPYSLKSNNGIDYKVNIAADIATDVTINAEVEGKEPANIYINNRGHQISGKLTINASKSHVEGENGIVTEVEAHTSNSTFVVKSTLTITGLTVKKGSVVVEGKDNGYANVEKVTIPADVEGAVNIDVTGVSAEGNNRVEIVNNSAPENVSVVIEKDDKTVGGESKEYYVTQNAVTPVEKDIVATIGKTGYETLAAAVEAVKTGETIILIKDVVLESPIETNKTFTLKLNADITPISGWQTNGNTTDALVIIKRGGNITINGTGKISSNGVANAYAAVKLTNKNEAGTGDAAKLTVDGTVTLEGYYYGICGNGSRHNTFITVNGGTVKGYAENDNAGIYHPQNGTLTINGGTIEGAVGVYVKSGNVVTSVTGGTIKGVGIKKDYKTTGDGLVATGDAIAFDNCDYPGGAPNADIKGGTFTSTNASAVASYAKEGKEPITGFISGGTFSSDPWKYCAKGYASIEQGGKWVIVPAPKADVVRVHPDPDFSNVPQTILDNITVPFYQVKEMQGNIPVPVVEGGRILLSTDNQNGVYTLDNIISGSPYATLNGLDVCYIFAAREDDGTDGKFDEWNADFVISLDRTVQKDEIGLWGSYSGYLSRAFTAPYEIPANTEVPLLGTMTGGISNFSYSMIKSTVKVFPCGAFKLSDNIKGATMKVDLRIYDPDKSEKYFVIESYEYTFTNETNAVISKEVNSQDELNDAIANAKAGDGISIAAAGTYSLPNLSNNITISGVEGVEFDCTGSGSIASIPNGATFKNVKIAFGQTSYHGFQHSGRIIMEGCTLEGLFFGYGDMVFNDCTFKQPNSEYLMWTYGSEYLEFNNCKFDVAGKALNVYQENSPKDHVIIINNCEFKSSTVNKPALAIKNNGNNGTGTTPIYYDITITNSTFEGFGQSDGDLRGFPTETPYVNAYGYNHADKPLKVTVDGVVRVNIPKN